MTEVPSMSEVVRIARSWIGTPYRHQGARKGVGCDCLGLVRGIWRELYGDEPETPPPYGIDWAERSGEERLHAAALRYFGQPLAKEAMQPGDLLLFRWQEGVAAKHLGILSEPRWFIHAYEAAGVVEVRWCRVGAEGWLGCSVGRVTALHSMPSMINLFCESEEVEDRGEHDHSQYR